MSIRVQIKQTGEVAEFPDEATPEQISSALKGHVAEKTAAMNDMAAQFFNASAPFRSAFGAMAQEEPESPVSKWKPKPRAEDMLLGPDGLKRESGMEPGTELTTAIGEAAADIPSLPSRAIEAAGAGVLKVANLPTTIANRGRTPNMPGYIPKLEELPRPKIPRFEGSKNRAVDALEGAANVAILAGEQLLPPFAPPEVGLTLPLLGVNGLISRIAAGTFATATLQALPEEVRHAIRVVKDPNASTREKVEAVGQPGVTATFAAMMTHGATKGAPIKNPLENAADRSGQLAPDAIRLRPGAEPVFGAEPRPLPSPLLVGPGEAVAMQLGQSQPNRGIGDVLSGQNEMKSYRLRTETPADEAAVHAAMPDVGRRASDRLSGQAPPAPAEPLTPKQEAQPPQAPEANWETASDASGPGTLPEKRTTRSPGDRVRHKDGRTGTIIKENADGSFEVMWRGSDSTETVQPGDVTRSTSVKTERRSEIVVYRVGSSWQVRVIDENGNFHTAAKYTFGEGGGYGTEQEARASAIRDAHTEASQRGYAGFYEQTGSQNQQWTTGKASEPVVDKAAVAPAEPTDVATKPEGWSDERWEIFQKQRKAAVDANTERMAKFQPVAPAETAKAPPEPTPPTVQPSLTVAEEPAASELPALRKADVKADPRLEMPGITKKSKPNSLIVALRDLESRPVREVVLKSTGDPMQDAKLVQQVLRQYINDPVVSQRESLAVTTGPNGRAILKFGQSPNGMTWASAAKWIELVEQSRLERGQPTPRPVEPAKPRPAPSAETLPVVSEKPTVVEPMPVWKVSYTDLETRAAKRPFFKMTADVEAPTRTSAIERVRNYYGNGARYGEFRASKADVGTKPMSQFRHIEESAPEPQPTPSHSPAAAKVEAQVKKVAATEGQRPAKEIKAEYIQRVEDEINSLIKENDNTENVLRKSVQSPDEKGGARWSYGDGGVYADVERTKDGKYKIVTSVQSALRSSKDGKVFLRGTFKTLEECEWFLKAVGSTGNGKITVDIPGDGITTIFRHGPSLIDVWQGAKSIEVSPGGKSKVPMPGNGEKVDADEIADSAKRLYGDNKKAIAGIERQLASEQEMEPGQRELLERAAQIMREDTIEFKRQKRIDELNENISDDEQNLKTAQERIAKTKSEMKSKAGTARQRQFIYEQENLIRNVTAQLPGKKAELERLSEAAQAEAKPTAPAEATGGKAESTVADDWTSATRDTPEPQPASSGVAGLAAEPPTTELHAGIPIPRFANRKMSPLDKTTASHSAKLQTSFDEARRAQREIAKVARTDRRQGAISVWLEAKGDIPTLRAWATAAKGKLFRQAAIDAQALSPAEIAIAGKVRAAFDALFARGTSYDVVKSHRDAYVTHVWEVKRPGTGWGGSVLKERFKFSKARTFSTFFDGDQAGFVPRTLAIGKLLPAYLHEMNKVIADRQFVKDLSAQTAADGRPLAIPRGRGETVESGTADEAHLVFPNAMRSAKDAAGLKIDQGDYRVMEGQPALNAWRWIDKDSAGHPIFLKADVALHPDAYRRVNAMIGQSAIRSWARDPVGGMAQVPKAIVRGIDTAQSAMKREMFGLLAPFHQVQEGTHAIGHLVNPFFGLEKIDMRNPDQMDAARHGLMLLPDRASAGRYLEGVGTHSSLISQGLRKIPRAGAIVADVIDGYQDYLFHQYIPALKFKTYQAMVSRNTKLYTDELASGAMTLADVKITSAEQANAAYGHLNYALLDRNPTIQHLTQLSLLAPDFLEARARFAAQGGKGISSKVGHEQFKAIAILAAAQAGTAFVLASLLGDEYDPRHPFEVIHKGRRYTMRSVPEDMFSLANDSRQFIYARVNPLVARGGIQLLTGLNYRGEKTSPMETVTELLAGYIPITARSIPGLRSLTETGRNSAVTPLQQLAGSLGLRVSRYSPISETYKRAGEWMDSKKIPRDTGSYPISKYQQLRYALEDGDLHRAQSAYAELRKTMSSEKIATGLASSVNHPFTTSAAMDRQFAASLKGRDRKLYTQALVTRRHIMSAFRSMGKNTQ